MRFIGLCHRMACTWIRPPQSRPPATSAAWLKATQLIILVAALIGIVAACGTSAQPGDPHTGCAQAHTPVTMITAAPGPVTAQSKAVAHVLGSARFTKALKAAESVGSEELRAAEQRLSADGRAIATHPTAHTWHAVMADLRAIQTRCR